ncbi:uncharacterized protein si:ch73-52p7.1 [Conger conger]|uniref:uncharacterized protein si:ch73-52p7.1 n=1 Tax=Conger conger TaxID=82655 RepID=UPI002A5A9CEE|nr:uncharacterized protein si:ch73-52p7.1 [Conger conger]
MSPAGLGRVVLTCVIWAVAPLLLRSEFELAHVSEQGLRMCSCAGVPAPCAAIDGSQCNCTRRHGDGLLQAARLTVWYSSPLHAALLLNNSQVRHLSLVRCRAAGGGGAPHPYFSVQRLERLTVSSWQADRGHSVELGAHLGPHGQEARLAIIHTSVLTGKAAMKAYTVRAKVDANGALPFPDMRMTPAGLPATAVVLVTFLY